MTAKLDANAQVRDLDGNGVDLYAPI
jgi:hypothetical protein